MIFGVWCNSIPVVKSTNARGLTARAEQVKFLHRRLKSGWEEIVAKAPKVCLWGLFAFLPQTSEREIMSLTRKSSVSYITKIGILSAMAAVLMLIEFPLAFLAPPFYKLDLSEVPILIGSFAMGPAAGVLMELVKNVIHIIVPGTSTNFVGEIANFITGCAYVLPAALLYRVKKNRKTALIGMLIGTVSLAVIGSILNYYFLIPAFSALYGLPLDAIVEMGAAVYPAVTDLALLVVLCVAPFNFVKGVICSIFTFALYKRVSHLLRV